MVPFISLILMHNTSIVIPALCSSLDHDFLTTAISIRMQSTLPDEVIVVASECKGKSIDSLISLYKRLLFPIKSRVFFYPHKKRQGVSRNFGMKLASGSHILFFDSDDIMIKDYVKIVMDLFNQNNAKMVLHSFHPVPIKCGGQVPKVVANTTNLKAMAKAHKNVHWISESIAHGHVSVRSDTKQKFDSGSDGEDGRFVRNVLENECIQPLDCIQTSAKLSLYIGNFYQKRLGKNRSSFMLEHLINQLTINCH